jgi:glycine/D-amino acid oxidase-like deaminating enzyme
LSERDSAPTMAVIGGGIVGAVIAHMAAVAGFRTMLFRRCDLQKPEADTLRNHGWFQSGLLYGRDQPLAADTMRWAGPRLLHEYGIPRPAERGLFRVKTEAEATGLLETARRLDLMSQVDRLTEAEARNLLGPFHRPGLLVFRVPDGPFDQAALLEAIRGECVRAGAVLRDVETAVVLEPRVDEPGRFRVMTEDGPLDPDVTVVATGCMIAEVLRPLGIEPELRVQRSPLLNMAAGNHLEGAPLLVDRHTNLTVLRHRSETWNGGVLVVGSRGRFEPDDKRQTSEAEQRELLDLLPEDIRPTLGSDDYRMTAGHKTEGKDKSGKWTVAPWLLTPPQWPGLIAAIPGKATSALAAAIAVMARVAEFVDSSPTGIRPWPRLANSWINDVHMHFEYPNLNERQT